tara:strand:+ start:4825 stop:5712 length:888 start_codon:yes stop_codon:yes gene_type:complete
MEFINEEKQTELGLTPEQVAGMQPLYESHVADLKGGWDGVANKNAEGIINGAISPIVKETGINRNDGEKAADYLTRVGTSFLSGKTAELDRVKAEYEGKIKGVNGSETLSAEYEAMKIKHDEVLQKYSNYDELSEKAAKADEYGTQLNTMKLEVAFGNVKPSFPDTVNKYEAVAKWNELKAAILETNTIELVDGVAMAVDKENPHKVAKLQDLVDKNEGIANLIQGRQQGGTGAKEASKVTIEGVPFEVPANATSEDRNKLIKEYLLKQGVSLISAEYSKKFSEYNTIILQKTAN